MRGLECPLCGEECFLNDTGEWFDGDNATCLCGVILMVSVDPDTGLATAVETDAVEEP